MVEYNTQMGIDLLKEFRTVGLKAYLVGSVAEYGYSDNDIDIVLILPPNDWIPLARTALMKALAKHGAKDIHDPILNDWGGGMFKVFCSYDILSIDILILNELDESTNENTVHLETYDIERILHYMNKGTTEWDDNDEELVNKLADEHQNRLLPGDSPKFVDTSIKIKLICDITSRGDGGCTLKRPNAGCLVDSCSNLSYEEVK